MTSLILISGPDGSGKSTVASAIARDLRRKGYPVKQTWLRYPRLFSLIPLILSKLLGTTLVIQRKGICSYKYHAYEALPPLGLIYQILILIDYIIYKFIKVWIPSKLGYTVILDRNLLDIVIDVYIETNKIPKILLKYLNYETRKTTMKVIILASIKNLLARRKDNHCNPHIKKVVVCYKIIGKHYDYKIYNNNKLTDLKKIINVITSAFKPVRVYADPSNQLVRALLYKHKWLIYITNFIFQAIGYMWWVEAFFRILLQITIILILLKIKVNIILALLISHSILYLFYNNYYAIKKWINSYETNNFNHLKKLLIKLYIINKKYSSCLKIVIVGSISRNPANVLYKQTDLDTRILPRLKFSCIILALIISMYLRAWSLLSKAPLDLYVKNIKKIELEKNYIDIKYVYNKLITK